MKSLFFITLIVLVLSCRQAERPSPPIASATPALDSVPQMVSLRVYKDSDSCDYLPPLDYEGNKDTIPKELEKFEQNGVVLKHLSYTKGNDKRPEWLKITDSNKPCKIIDMTSYSHDGWYIKDWNEDSFKDLVNWHGRYPESFTVYLFDTQTNDFVRINHNFLKKAWDFDVLKKQKIEHSDNNYYLGQRDFINTFCLYQVNKKGFKIISTITFAIEDGHCTVKIENGESEIVPTDAAFFDDIRKKADVFNTIRTKNEHDNGYIYKQENAQSLSETKRKDIEKKYINIQNQVLSKYDAWFEEAKPLVESYWRQKF